MTTDKKERTTRRMTPHRLALIVGVKPARILVASYGNCRLPTVRQWVQWQRRRAIVTDLRSGMDRPEVCLKYGISIYRLKQILTQELKFEAKLAQGEIVE